jgi:hypothetical protein
MTFSFSASITKYLKEYYYYSQKNYYNQGKFKIEAYVANKQAQLVTYINNYDGNKNLDLIF